MKNNLLRFAVAGALGLFTVAASAEEAYEGAWYALPGVSIMNADSDLDAENTDVGGFLRFGKEVSEHWDVQIGLSHNQVDEDDSQFTGGNYRQSLFGVDALYMFSRDKLRPFLLAGLGYAYNKVDYSAAAGRYGSGQDSLMANVGVGVQYLFNESFGIQADLRHVVSRVETGFVGDRDIDYEGNNYLNIGAIFRFGAPEKAVEPTPEPTPVAALPEIAPVDEAEALPALQGPQKPAFEKVTLQSEVLFGFDKDNLREEGKQRLDADVVEKMKKHPEVELVLITGHTDRIGTDDYNQRLSDRRARAVKKYLMDQGIAENRLHTVGKGESEPIVGCEGIRGKKAIECLQPNRRVVVEIEVQRASGN